MIEKLIINNFQSHKRTELTFAPSINVIVGQSDCGKSAIVRAINWVINNRPLGSSFQSHWGGNTTVLLKLNGAEILRGKTDKENVYKLVSDPQGNKDKIYKSFKQDVPEPLKIKIDMNEINLQSQLDAPFLLSKGAGEINRYLNSIINLGIIDTSLANADSERRATKANIEYGREDLKKLTERIKQFDFLDEYEKLVAAGEKINTTIVEKKKESLQLEKILDEYRNVSQELEKYKNLNEYKKAVIITEKKNDEVVDKRMKLDDMSAIFNTIGNVNQSLEKYSELLSYKKIVEKASEVSERVNEKIKDSKLLKAAHMRATLLINSLNKNEVELINAKENLNSIMPDICPVCGNKIVK